MPTNLKFTTAPRVLYAVALAMALILGSLSAVANPSSALVTESGSAETDENLGDESTAYVLYDDAIRNGFGDWSWAVVDTAHTGTVHSGTAAVSVDAGPWAAFYISRSDDQPMPLNGTLRFELHGGTSAGPIGVQVISSSGGSQPITVQPTPGSWTSYSLDLGELGGFSNFSGVWFQNQDGATRPTFYVDSVRIVPGEAPPPSGGPALVVDLGSRSITRTITDPASGQVSDQVISFPHDISEDVYGMNFVTDGVREELDVPVNRWGGNAVERYNFRNGTTNLGSDWYFMNQPNDIGNEDRFESANQADSVATLLTVPGIGWVAADRTARCGYPVDRYGPMDDSASHFLDYDLRCGNGKRSGEIVAGDPATTSVAVGPDHTAAWVSELVADHGPASHGGVELYAIGNEPGLWHATHADVVDQPVGRRAIIDNNIAHAAAIKRGDRSASVVGPVLWGGYSYYVTSAEMAAGQRPGDVPTFVADYLDALAEAEASAGQRLLDGLAINFYDDRVYWGGTDELRLEATRSLWDPTYAPEDWWVIRDFVGEGHAVIPRMQSLIDRHYPGTELNITEYNFGALDTLAGGLAQADALGIFGREGLDRAMLWDPYNEQLSAPLPEFIDRPGMWAYRMYRNYDGRGGSFGDRALFAESSDQDTLSVYGARRTDDGAITVMVINKSTVSQTSDLSIAGIAGPAEVYRYSGDNLGAIERLADVDVDQQLTTTYPARSITLLVIDAGQSPDPEPGPAPAPAPAPEVCGPQHRSTRAEQLAG